MHGREWVRVVFSALLSTQHETPPCIQPKRSSVNLSVSSVIPIVEVSS
jgi:hypothetical protein